MAKSQPMVVMNKFSSSDIACVGIDASTHLQQNPLMHYETKHVNTTSLLNPQHKCVDIFISSSKHFIDTSLNLVVPTRGHAPK